MGFGFGEGCGHKKKAAEKVSDAARELFYKHGIRAVGVDEIVNQAGVTKPSLYRSYASKDELIASCLRQQWEEGQARWDEALAKAPGNPRAQLSYLLTSFATDAEAENFRGCPVSNAVVEFPDPKHPVHRLAIDMKQECRCRFRSLVGQLDVADPEGLADGLLMLLEGFSTATQLFGGAGPAASFVKAAEALIDSHDRAFSAAESPAQRSCQTRT